MNSKRTRAVVISAAIAAGTFLGTASPASAAEANCFLGSTWNWCEVSGTDLKVAIPFVGDNQLPGKWFDGQQDTGTVKYLASKGQITKLYVKDADGIQWVKVNHVYPG